MTTLNPETAIGSLQQLAPGLWSIHTDFCFEGTPHNIGNRTLVIPVKDLEVSEALNVTYILTPGDFHYMRIKDWLPHFPSAKAYLPPGRIQTKVAENPFPYELLDAEVDNPLPELAPELVLQTVFGMKQMSHIPGHGTGIRIEYLFYHTGSKSVISGDSFWYAQDGFAVSAYYGPEKGGVGQIQNIGNVAGLKHTVARVLEWDFVNFISVHGGLTAFLTQDAKASFGRSVDFLANVPEDYKDEFEFVVKA
ncbi:hypothetical protein BCR33DRAFT_782182 [Rhizoclosmatium globosum]|uniref:Metallo-beta-lactamase domain-containing protein n=1 Tax=Rhizoclosmatium globosum TaxID=329046 RepID=A0A1Y2CN76_9FUNG|nr:hypothetical protein BCR33DRAFT_782182 [Rhizoclosmatium globosum]|eukprot:ORY48453.1 hypothetical protein BCR33DRAFT_782182 [Rhizoclosmatium globosum]